MTEAPRTRPEPHTVLRSFAGTIHAHPDAVFADLAGRVAPAGGEGMSTVDADERVIIVQGGWWYRAEYTVLEVEQGSRIEFELLNVAPTLHWAGALTGRSVVRESPHTFGALLTAMVTALE